MSASYTTTPFNKLTATSLATYAYDTNGSMTGKTAASVNWTYGWDRENRMVSAGNSTATANYYYDALGRRVKRTQGSTVQKYTHDGLDVVLDDTNSVLNSYQNGPGIDNKLKYNQSNGARYYLQNHLGSTIMSTNSVGGKRDTINYDSYGNSDAAGTRYQHQFTGREKDVLTGLQYSRARWYDPQNGRFVSEDPIGFIGGTNMYSYVNNIPTEFSDPLGLFPSIWPWDYHQRDTQKALDGLASPRDIQSISWSNEDFDSRTQDAVYAPYHAMRRPGQSAEEAQIEANEFVRNKICLAREYEKRGWHTAAMHEFGKAAHAVQDAKSPAHTGFQEAWADAPFSWLFHIPHYVREAVFVSNERRASVEATRQLWEYYRGAPMPSNFFPNSSDISTGCQCPR